MSQRCKFKKARLWIACEGTGDSTGGRAHSPRVSCVDQGVQHVCKFLLRMLGYVLVRQPTVILRRKSECLDTLTIESLRREVNAWICAPRSTDHDPALDKNLQYLYRM